MGGLVDAVGESADDGVAHGREVPTQLGGLMRSVVRRGARPHYGHGVGCELGEVSRSPDPQPDGFAAAVVQCAGGTQARELVGPLGIAGDDEPDAAAILEADRLGVALFQFTPEGLVVAINDAARGIAPRSPVPDQRTPFGALTFESRQNRAIRWSQQIEDATKVPISDRKRRGAKQLVERQRALELMLHGLEQLRDSDNPLYKRRRKERTLSEAEKTLKQAAAVLRIQLK